jgi:hypothetical protein
METKPTIRQQPFRAKRTMLAALAALTKAGFDASSDEFQATRKLGKQVGKHNGRCGGAFGGPSSAKAHRKLYINRAAPVI